MRTTNQEIERQRQKQGVQFSCKADKIEIPDEFKTIVIRVNFGRVSPYVDVSLWPDKGSVYSTGERGLFGVLLDQDLFFITRLSFIFYSPKYMILEADSRQVKQVKEYGCSLMEDNKCEFRDCNILFNGEIEDFLNELNRYTTKEQQERISNELDWKVKELKACMVSLAKMKEYVTLCEERKEIVSTVAFPGIFQKIAIEDIKKRQLQ